MTSTNSADSEKWRPSVDETENYVFAGAPTFPAINPRLPPQAPEGRQSHYDCLQIAR
jgi:hypothetical protein